MMDPKLKEKWVKALRSGKYVQGRHFLKNSTNQYCCLGVLADISGVKSECKDDEAGYRFDFDNSENNPFLTFPSREWLERIGLSDEKGKILAQMNDSGKDFQEIANHIRSTL